MSGGSLNYGHHNLKEVVRQLQDKSRSPLQRALGNHLADVITALHFADRVISYDISEDNNDEAEAIKKCLGQHYEQKVFDVLKSDAEELIKELEKFIKK